MNDKKKDEAEKIDRRDLNAFATRYEKIKKKLYELGSALNETPGLKHEMKLSLIDVITKI